MTQPLPLWETDLDTANRLLQEWPGIAKSIAAQCKWRAAGQCFIHCQGFAVCDLTGLTLVQENGRPAAPGEDHD
jgi:hypothetical protein